MPRCAYVPAGSRCDWQVVTEALMNKNNGLVQHLIFFSERPWMKMQAVVQNRREGGKWSREVNSRGISELTTPLESPSAREHT